VTTWGARALHAPPRAPSDIGLNEHASTARRALAQRLGTYDGQTPASQLLEAQIHLGHRHAPFLASRQWFRRSCGLRDCFHRGCVCRTSSALREPTFKLNVLCAGAVAIRTSSVRRNRLTNALCIVSASCDRI
jgi:hypothetical protein